MKQKLWTLRADLSDAQRAEVIGIGEEATARFEKEIQGLIKADVVWENRLDLSNCDFMFDMYFASAQALAEFSVNPDNLAVVTRLKP